jgi:hypothetical protein
VEFFEIGGTATECDPNAQDFSDWASAQQARRSARNIEFNNMR